MALRSNLTTKVGGVFTKVWNKLEGSATTLTLMKASGVYDEFDEVLELDGKWFFEYSNFRKNFLLEIADDTDALTTAIGEATHIKVDDDIYVINSGDTTGPKGTDVTWKIYCDLFERRSRYSTLGV